MIKKIFFVSILFFSTQVFAQSSAAHQLIQDAMTRINAIASYSVDATVEMGKDIYPIKIYSNGEKYRFTAPFLDRVFDGKYNYNIMTQEKEINIETPSKSDATFGSISKILSNLYSSYTPSIGAKEGDIQYLLLTSKNTNLKSEVTLGINTKTKMLHSITDKSPSRTTNIKILKIDPQGVKDNSIFAVDKSRYKAQGYHIVEP